MRETFKPPYRKIQGKESIGQDIAVWVYRHAMQLHFIVAVWPSTASGAADAGDHLATLYTVTPFHQDLVVVPITRDDTVAVVDLQKIAIAVILSNVDHHAVCGGYDRGIHAGGNIQPFMNFTHSGKG